MSELCERGVATNSSTNLNLWIATQTFACALFARNDGQSATLLRVIVLSCFLEYPSPLRTRIVCKSLFLSD